MIERAIINVADCGPAESLICMLRSVGIHCYYPSRRLRDKLRTLELDTVLEVDNLVREWGYDPPMPLPEANETWMDDPKMIFVDVKAHRNAVRLWKRWPKLNVLWYRINGCEPEHVVNQYGDHGDERNPPCPILTPNQWYKEDGSWKEKSYVCWPPFWREGDYLPKNPRPTEDFGKKGAQIKLGPRYESPICLIHNVGGWGYATLLKEMQDLGVKIHGRGSPDGLINHREVPVRLGKALAMVHLKSNDAPGYSIYECLSAGCPLVCTKRLIWRSRMQDLLIPGQTCLTFDRETHDPLSDEDVRMCKAEVAEHLQRLSNPEENKRIGMAGHDRLQQIMWSDRRKQDVDSLRSFLERMYP